MFKNILIPAYFIAKNRKRIEIYNNLKKKESLSLEELKKIQWLKLKNLLDHCYYNIPYYTNLFKKHDIHPEDINNYNDFYKIRELKKSDVKDNTENLKWKKILNQKLSYSSTSGSTGVPLRIARTQYENDYACALKMRSNSWCGWKYWEKSLWLITDQRQTGQLDTVKGRALLSLFRKLMISTKNITKESMFEWAKRIKKYRPKHVYGYSSILTEFSQFIIENNIKIEGVEGVYSTAEPLRARSIISQAFNSPVYDQYGSSEISCIAHECRQGSMHINIDEVLVEFVDIEKDFEAKKMVCTPLYLYGMPLLRYDTNDIAVLSNTENCKCGLPYPVIKLQVGRISDNLLSSAGKLVSGISLCSYMVLATKNVRQFQFIQESINEIKVKLSCSPGTENYNEEEIKNLLYEMMGTYDLKINFEYMENIPAGANGKFRPVISKVSSLNQPLLY